MTIICPRLLAFVDAPNEDGIGKGSSQMLDFTQSEIVKRLVRDGMRNGSVGAETMHRIKGPASSTDALCGGVEADAREGFEYRPTAVRGDTRSRSAMRSAGHGPAKSRVGEPDEPSPVSRPVMLRVVASNTCKPTHVPTRFAPRGVGFHLVLVSSQ